MRRDDLGWIVADFEREGHTLASGFDLLLSEHNRGGIRFGNILKRNLYDGVFGQSDPLEVRDGSGDRGGFCSRASCQGGDGYKNENNSLKDSTCSLTK